MRAVAHTPPENSNVWHDLATHLSSTAALAHTRAEKFGTGELAYLAGLMHDVGKYNPAFQQYLIDAHAGREALSAPHAIYGALMAVEQGVPELSQVIYGHHAGMPSVAGLQDAFANPETIETYQQVKEAANEVTGGGASSGVAVDLHGEMLLRMVFSALVDSDYIDTERHFDPGRAGRRTPAPRVAQLLPELLASQKRIMSGKTGAVNEVRREVYESCLKAAKLPGGFTDWSPQPELARREAPWPSPSPTRESTAWIESSTPCRI